ncbi:MAG: hypothetical protein SGPRY_007547, partial [Prymnesium sp.]
DSYISSGFKMPRPTASHPRRAATLGGRGWALLGASVALFFGCAAAALSSAGFPFTSWLPFWDVSSGNGGMKGAGRAVGGLSADYLSHFSNDHNESLLWGTYRPGTYFGLRSRTAPTGLVAGLMWAASGAGGSEGGPLRHECEQDGIERYGYTAHDGEGYASQRLVDKANGIELHTWFLADGSGGWAARVEGKTASGSNSGRPQSIFVYLAVEDEYAVGEGGELRLGGALQGNAAHLQGEVPSLGPFSVVARASDGSGRVKRARTWGTQGDRPSAYTDVRNRVLSQLANSDEGSLHDGMERGSRLAVVQIDLAPPFT